MGRFRYKVKVKFGKIKKQVVHRVKTVPYVGEETLRQKQRADSLQLRLDSLQHKIDSVSGVSKDSVQVQMKVKWAGKQQ